MGLCPDQGTSVAAWNPPPPALGGKASLGPSPFTRFSVCLPSPQGFQPRGGIALRPSLHVVAPALGCSRETKAGHRRCHWGCNPCQLYSPSRGQATPRARAPPVPPDPKCPSPKLSSSQRLFSAPALGQPIQLGPQKEADSQIYFPEAGRGLMVFSFSFFLVLYSFSFSPLLFSSL